MKTINVFFCFLLLVIVQSAYSQVPFNRGVNLTNWFHTENAHQIQFKRFTKQDFINIKSLGCDVIRLPMHLHYYTNGAPDYIIDPLFFDFLDQAVSWAEDLQIYILLDNHLPIDPSINTDLNVGTILNKVWTQMAQHYKDRSGYIIYEVFNEPHGITTQQWGTIQQGVIDAIRVIDTKHTIIVGGSDYNRYNELKNLPVYSDTNLIYTFHFYDPFLFTHQGASWTNPSMEPLAGVPFPYDVDSMPECPDELKGSWIESVLNNYSQDGTVEKVKELIDIAVEFKNSRNVPIFCGEFGVYIPNSPRQDRLNWYDTVRTYLENKEIAWTIWDYTGGFGLFEKGSFEMFDYDLNVPLLQALDFNVPEQKVYVLKSDSVGFMIYFDYIGQQIYYTGQPSNDVGTIDFYSIDKPNNGKYCIYWTDAVQYNTIGFDFKPDKDFSKLLNEDYAIDFFMRGNSPDSKFKFDIRFIDTKTIQPDDHHWRIRYTIDKSVAPLDRYWHHVRIPLKDFTEHGSWDNNTWYNPEGKFDWTAIDRFEIVAEYSAMTSQEIWFDDIRITEPSEVKPQTPYLGNAVQLPGQIEAENYDFGGAGIAYWDSDSGNNGEQYRDDDVDIEYTLDTGGGYDVCCTEDGEWLEYTVNSVADTMNIDVRVATIHSDREFCIKLNGETLGTDNVPKTGGWQTWQTIRIPNVVVAGGQNQILRFEIIKGCFNLNWIKFTSKNNTGISKTDIMPIQFALDQNYPNPFNPETVIHLSFAP